MNEHKDVEALKRRIRGMINMAGARGKIDGVMAVAILQSICAEFVSKVDDDDARQGYIEAIQNTLPQYVERERTSIEGMTRQ